MTMPHGDGIEQEPLGDVFDLGAHTADNSSLVETKARWRVVIAKFLELIHRCH
jgi:hypothetical protein